MLHNLHSRHVWMHRHVLIWFPAGKAPASRSPTVSSGCHPLRLCEGEGGMEARARPGPRARFEALTSDRNPSSTTTRQPLRRAPPGAEVSLSPLRTEVKWPGPRRHLLARLSAPCSCLPRSLISSTWSTAPVNFFPVALVCGHASFPGRVLAVARCSVTVREKVAKVKHEQWCFAG